MLIGILLVVGLVIIRTKWSSDQKTPQETVRTNEEFPAATSVVSDGVVAAPTLPTDEATPFAAGSNAADLYEQAYALFDRLTPKEKELLQGRGAADASAAAALFVKIQPILALLRSATGADYCDWGLGSWTINTPMTHMQKVMNLGSVTGWSVSYLFSQDPEAAIGVIFDHASLGNSVGNHALIGLLAESSLETKMDSLLRENFARLTPAQTAKLETLFSDYGVGKDFHEAFQTEVSLLRNHFAAKFSDNDIQGAVRTYGSPEQIEQILKHYENASKTIGNRDAAFAQWKAEMQSLLAGAPNLLADFPKEAKFSIVDAVETIRNKIQKRMVERRMLEAALSLKLNTPQNVGSFLDPNTQQPFIYRRTPDGGFEFESRTTFNGQPIVLKF